MKTKFYYLFWIATMTLLPAIIFAQGVAINEDESPAHPSAMLDVQSSNKGILIPRLSLLEMADIVDPPEGLMLFCTDCHESGALVVFFNGAWSAIDKNVTTNSLSPPINMQYGGSNNDHAYDLDKTEDGGFVLAGSSTSSDGDVGGNNGNYDFWIVKVEQAGNIEWESNFGGSSGEEAYSIKRTNDNGYIIAGFSSSSDGDVGGNNGSGDFWVVKISSTGSLEWETNLGGSSSEKAKAIQQTNDNGYIIAGDSESSDGDVGGNNGSIDYWVVKLTSSGSLEWENNYGGSSYDQAESVKQTSDGGYIVAGYSYSSDGDVGGSNGSDDYWIVKINSSGVIEWETNLGGSSGDQAKSIQQTSDGGYIVAGSTYSSDGDVGGNFGGKDIWIAKLSPSGSLEWENNIGSIYDEFASSIQQTNDGGYIVGGNRQLTGTNGRCYKLSSTGDLEWEGIPNAGELKNILQLADGYIVLGETGPSLNKDYKLVKLDAEGNMQQ